VPEKSLSRGGRPMRSAESRELERAKFNPKKKGPGGVRARGEPLTCPVQERKGRMVSSTSSNDGTGERGFTLDPINPLGTMTGTTPPSAGAPRAEGIVVVEDKGSTRLAEQMGEVATERR
jgi:hypothetical protein